MDNQKKERNLKLFLYLFFFIALMAVVFYFFPDKLVPSLQSSWTSLSQFLLIFPALILLIGIFSMYITTETIEKNFGKKTGFSGALKALGLGSLMSTGPFYMSFPMAKNLLQKGAKITDVFIFVSAWNGVGIIAEIVEIYFLGPLFMVVRCSLTALLILVIGYIGGYLAKDF